MGDRDPVIIGGARTGIGRLLGSLSGFSAAELGGFAIKGALDRAGMAPEGVEYVIMGHVLQAGTGQITARQAAVKAGIPMTTPATTVNKVCLSGLDAIAQAADLIRLGEFDVVVAGGMESMSNAPHVLKGSRQGYKYGPVELLDSMAYDGLTDVFNGLSMGESTDLDNARLGISRERQDEFAARSQQRAARAAKDGLLADEIVPVEVTSKRETITFNADEGVRGDTTIESLARLRPAFGADGTITAGTASQISDGAAAVVVTSRATAERLGASILAEVGVFGTVAGPDSGLHFQPVERDRQGPRQGRPRRQGPGPDRDQRGVRRRRRRLHGRARRLARHRQRQRRRDRGGPPARRVRHPDRAHPRLRAAPPGRRPRRGGALRRRRPGLGPAAARPLRVAAPKRGTGSGGSPGEGQASPLPGDLLAGERGLAVRSINRV